MSAWIKMLDNWCLEHADCNLFAWKSAEYRDPKLVSEFIEFIENAVPLIATHTCIVKKPGTVPDAWWKLHV